MTRTYWLVALLGLVSFALFSGRSSTPPRAQGGIVATISPAQLRAPGVTTYQRFHANERFGPRWFAMTTMSGANDPNLSAVSRLGADRCSEHVRLFDDCADGTTWQPGGTARWTESVPRPPAPRGSVIRR